ncbi:type I-F CRISPR-associated helicase Cas3f [Abyssibacter sp.]|uniref:type I-F CRISPR-associated helicase Cas3f n=1 Tax=Abyssibacter sp. TaxID=2320200 RepID=UPI003518B313
MNVLLVSQCDKRALTETRRILDQFAERRGDRTWQTPITQAGLDTLRRLLRKTARKNTAVACHWIRGRDHSELLWVVGNAGRFNAEGAVPTNRTQRDVLRRASENDWHTAQDIRLLAQLAALLHDLGKASVAFQQRLRGELQERNLYRHEWVSLRLFQAFVGDCDDASWLQRLADPSADDEALWTAPKRYQRDGLDEDVARPFDQLPPLAAAVAWLVVTHHRLPTIPQEQRADFNVLWLEQPLSLVDHTWNERYQSADRKHVESYWTMADQLPVVRPKWRAQAARLARQLLTLRERRSAPWLKNPYVMHLARLSLMLADHHYSAHPADASQRVEGDGDSSLFANTGPEGNLKQALDEHLLGVARDAGQIAYALPGFERDLPRLARHRGLRKRSGSGKFAWQDKATDAAVSLRQASVEQGAFIVNMASTGCGKTLANLRMLNALADPQQGFRATYALGLRTLTLQTGRSYREDLRLGEDELAILVGGSGSRSLFEYYEQRAESHGSASVQALIDEDSHVLFEGNTADHPLLSRAMQDANIRKLISAPVVVCTVDHIAPATESLRAGRQIAPMLRLMSSDLVLDELDDYDLDDLPALTRLVHWAGLLGTRVVLSSATLPPALVEGMFMAYHAGRLHYARNRGLGSEQAERAVQVPCLWVDEFSVQRAHCPDATMFIEQHTTFVQRRTKELSIAEPLRRGELLPLTIGMKVPDQQQYAEFAEPLRDACVRLHQDHAEVCPHSGKHVSFGIVRMANIEPLVGVARALFQLGGTDDVRIHLCVYHARFPQVQRSAIEHQLDQAFNRRRPEAVYAVPDIRHAIDAHPEPHHLFVVLASPVCEVGRDWDADWAVAEPSSLRALIQLAGRVQRHRRKLGDRPNLLILDTNLRHFKGERGPDGQPGPVFLRPGFEQWRAPVGHPFRLLAHHLSKLMAPEEYTTVSALPRMVSRPLADLKPQYRLVDLEHARMQDRMLPAVDEVGGRTLRREPNAATAWRYSQAALTGMLQQRQPFRDDSQPSVMLAFLPDDEEERLLLHRVEEERGRRGQTLYVEVDQSLRHDMDVPLGACISAWGEHDLLGLLIEQSDYLNLPLRRCAETLATISAPKSDHGWAYHEALGLIAF